MSDGPPISRAPQEGRAPVAFALSVRDRRLFFGADDPPVDLDAPHHWLDDGELAGKHWPGSLARLYPACVVTGWGTPPLPEQWLGAGECPVRYVCHVAGSVRHLVPRGFVARGGLVSNWGSRVGASVAEHGLLLALSLLRNQPAWRPFIQRAVDSRQIEDLKTRTLFGRRIGLHGFGNVARGLVTLLRPFGVSLRAYSEGVPPQLMRAEGVAACGSIEQLFSESEVLFECEALTPETAGCVDARILSLLPDGAVFINIGRGGLIDDRALVDELTSGRISAALDVANHEPLTPESPFWDLPNTILSPHIAGPTRDQYLGIGKLAVDNVRRFLAGETPLNIIDLAAYDRST